MDLVLSTLPASQFFRGIFDGGTMPKAKTHKGIAKRFKVTGSGKKAKHRSANRGHILGKKSGKRKRHLRNGGIVDGANARMIVEAVRPSL